MKIIPWETPCSFAAGLYWIDTADEGTSLSITFSDKNLNYKFVFKEMLAYQVYDETYLNFKDGYKLGQWTFEVLNSNWINHFDEGLVKTNFSNGLKHFLITSFDTCIEVLSSKQPEIVQTKSA